jgi:hypothetical protein
MSAARAYIKQRIADHTPPPPMDEIRRRLGWGLLPAFRSMK